MSDTTNGVRRPRIVIAGNGVTAWLVAASLARAADPDRFSIRVVGRGAGDDSQADAVLPVADELHAALQLDEDGLVAGAGASFSLGIALSGWSGPDTTWFQPFGTAGAGIGPVSFPHIVFRLRQQGMSLRLANYSMAALAAQSQRFARPVQDPQSVLSTCQYGMHLDLAAFGAALQATAQSAGVAHSDNDVLRAETGADGSIRSLVLDHDETVDGDLFIDCTGTAASLIAQLDGADWIGWSDYLPCTHTVSARVAYDGAPVPYSHAQAHRAGWIQHLPLQGSVQVREFHDAGNISDDEVLALLAESSGTPVDATVATMRTGRQRNSWVQNCIAVGAASACIDPVGVTNLQLARSSIDRLLRLLPAGADMQTEAREYNRQCALQFDHARDFAIAHYKLNGRSGDPTWDACRNMAVPETLEYKLELYRSRGRIAMYDNEPLEEASWINLFDEQGLQPRHYNPLANGFDGADLQAHLQRVRAIMIDELGKMPLHGDYLARLRARADNEGS